ncbi:MAG TPA: hypothetical protein VIK72_16120 [Clostridiaceae bacterium]
MNEIELCNIIATLCGEDFIAYDKNFYNNLKVSIEKHLGKSPRKIPKALIPQELGKAAVNKSAAATDIGLPTESEPMDIILKKIHINLLEDFTKEDKTSIFSRNL